MAPRCCAIPPAAVRSSSWATESLVPCGKLRADAVIAQPRVSEPRSTPIPSIISARRLVQVLNFNLLARSGPIQNQHNLFMYVLTSANHPAQYPYLTTAGVSVASD